jgi:hypothetical protein
MLSRSFFTFGPQYNILVDSPFVKGDSNQPSPTPSNAFLLLDGTDLMLLDATDFLLLGS